MERGIPEQFTNTAGSYDLLKVENGRTSYRFTNRRGEAVVADVPTATWCRLAEQAKGREGGVDVAVERRAA